MTFLKAGDAMNISSKMIGYGLQYFGRNQEIAIDLLEAFFYSTYNTPKNSLFSLKTKHLLGFYLGLDDKFVFAETKVGTRVVDLVLYRHFSYIYDSVLKHVPESSLNQALFHTGTAFLPLYDPEKHKYEFPLTEFYYSVCGLVAFGAINGGINPFQNIVERSLFNYCDRIMTETFKDPFVTPNAVSTVFLKLFRKIDLLPVNSGSADQIDVAFDNCFLGLNAMFEDVKDLNLSIDFKDAFWSQPFSALSKGGKNVSDAEMHRRSYIIHLFFNVYHACAACPHSKRLSDKFEWLFEAIPSAIIEDKSIFKVFKMLIDYIKDVFSTSNVEWVKIIVDRALRPFLNEREAYKFTPYLESQWNLIDTKDLPYEWTVEPYNYVEPDHNNNDKLDFLPADLRSGRWLYILKMYHDWNSDRKSIFESDDHLDLGKIESDINYKKLDEYVRNAASSQNVPGGLDPELTDTYFSNRPDGDDDDDDINDDYISDIVKKSQFGDNFLERKKPSPKKVLIAGAIALSCAALVFGFYGYKKKKSSVRK